MALLRRMRSCKSCWPALLRSWMAAGSPQGAGLRQSMALACLPAMTQSTGGFSVSQEGRGHRLEGVCNTCIDDDPANLWVASQSPWGGPFNSVWCCWGYYEVGLATPHIVRCRSNGPSNRWFPDPGSDPFPGCLGVYVGGRVKTSIKKRVPKRIPRAPLPPLALLGRR
jgi:hypothetical protein